MNRTDRLLAIVLELQAKGWQRAEDLAATLEISRRTIYRDMQALGESGVPIMAEPGRGFAIMEGYFLPPLSLTTEEAIVLLLGTDTMAQNFDQQYQRAAGVARSKIETILPEHLRAEVDELQRSMRFVQTFQEAVIAKPELLRQLRTAILQRRRLRFTYHTKFSQDDDPTPKRRDADPYALAHVEKAWYLLAYCHLRKGLRHFRLDRIDDLQILPTSFTRPADFRIHSRVDEVFNVCVRAVFSPAVTRWVLEEPSYFQSAAEETPEGLMATFRVRHTDELLQWLLGWGANVRVLEPQSLQERLVEEARRVLANYESLLP